MRGTVILCVALCGLACAVMHDVAPLDESEDVSVLGDDKKSSATTKDVSQFVKKAVKKAGSKAKKTSKIPNSKDSAKAVSKQVPKPASKAAAKVPCHHDGCFKGKAAKAVPKKVPCHHDGCFGGAGKKAQNSKAGADTPSQATHDTEKVAIGGKKQARNSTPDANMNSQMTHDIKNVVSGGGNKAQSNKPGADTNSQMTHDIKSVVSGGEKSLAKSDTSGADTKSQKQHARKRIAHKNAPNNQVAKMKAKQQKHRHHHLHRRQNHGYKHGHSEDRRHREEEHRRRRDEDHREMVRRSREQGFVEREQQSLRESNDNHRPSFEQREFARYQAGAEIQADRMVHRLLDQHESRKMEIMDASSEGADDAEEQADDLGESVNTVERSRKKVAKEHFDAVHVPHSGDIEDGDKHFVMTSQLRHVELKRAVQNKSEKTEEEKSTAVAQRLVREKQAIGLYETLDAGAQNAKRQQAKMQKLIKSRLKKHHLMRDKKGRIVPDV